MEECTGKGFMGTQGKERESGNEEEKVTVSTRNAGKGIQCDRESIAGS